jgi:hypothetical protein
MQETRVFKGTTSLDSLSNFFGNLVDNNFKLTESGQEIFKKLLNKYGFWECHTCVKLSIERYVSSMDNSTEVLNALDKIGGIAYNRSLLKESLWQNDL